MNDWRKSSYSFANGNCVEASGDWRTSSYSGGNGQCVEAAGDWRKSTASANNGACAEVGQDGAVVLVRDSKLGAVSPVLSFSPEAWAGFLAEVKRR